MNTTNAPDNFSLAGASGGGIAGFAKGGTDVDLIANGDNTLLRYTTQAETGGKITKLGSQIITSTACKLSKAFFKNFEIIMRGKMSLDSDPPPPAKQHR